MGKAEITLFIILINIILLLFIAGIILFVLQYRKRKLIHEKEKRPLIKDLSDEQLKGYIAKKFSDRKIYYEQASIIFDEEPAPLDKLIEKIFHA